MATAESDSRVGNEHDVGVRPGVRLRHLGKTFSGPAGEFHALRDVNLDLPQGQLVAIVGRSGSGKSTLLNMMAGLDLPSTGEVRVGRTAVHRLNEDDLARFRGTEVGVVFQFFQLLPTLTVAENVTLAMDFVKVIPSGERRARALELLDRVGVADQAHKLPAALSGGQQQRAAIARALANDPAVMVADEPTGNLDSRTAAGVIEVFKGLARAGKLVVLVTHDQAMAAVVDRIVELDDGRVVADSRPVVVDGEAA